MLVHRAASCACTFLFVSNLTTAQTPIIRVLDAERVVVNDSGDIAFLQDFGTSKALFAEKALALSAPSARLFTSFVFPAGFPTFPQARINDFGPFSIDGAGNLVASVDVADPLNASLANTLYRRADVAITNLDELQGSPFSAGTPWNDFDGLVQASPSGPVLISGTASDPNIPGVSDEFLARVEFQPSGAVQSVDVLAFEGGPAPGLAGFTMRPGGFPTSQAQADINSSGTVIWTARIEDAAQSEHVLFLDDQVLIRGGTPSPLPGQDWSSKAAAAVAINEAGDWAALHEVRSLTQIADDVVVKNGDIYVTEGDSLPGNVTIRDLITTAPIEITAAGDPVYLAILQSGNDALILGDRVLAEAGVTLVEGLQLTGFDRGRGAFSVSPNGRFVIFKASLEFGVEAHVQIDLGVLRPIYACTPNQARLTASGNPNPGGSVLFLADGGQSFAAQPYLLFSSAPWPSAMPPCGLTVSSGELLINFGDGDPLAATLMSSGLFRFNLSLSPALINLELFAQALFVDPGTPEPFRLTNAMQVLIGS